MAVSGATTRSLRAAVSARVCQARVAGRRVKSNFSSWGTLPCSSVTVRRVVGAVKSGPRQAGSSVSASAGASAQRRRAPRASRACNADQAASAAAAAPMP